MTTYEGSAPIHAIRAYLGSLTDTPTVQDVTTVLQLLGQGANMAPKDLAALASGRRKRVATKSIASSAGSAAASAASDHDDHDHDDHDDSTARTPDASPRKRAKSTTKPAAKSTDAPDDAKVYDTPDWYDYHKEVTVFCFLCNEWFSSGVNGVKDSHNFKSRGIGTTCSTKGKTLSDQEQAVVALTTNIKVKLIAKLGNRDIVPVPWTCKAVFQLIKDVTEFMILNHLDMDRFADINIADEHGNFPSVPKYTISIKPAEKKKGKHIALENFEQ